MSELTWEQLEIFALNEVTEDDEAEETSDDD